ncbi:hypothetical protein Aph02nite_70180 [Actinoplanes philippinensis]|nr:hypothetical protein Aph02nite_70180 [Actinoplanes philippinensis]
MDATEPSTSAAAATASSCNERRPDGRGSFVVCGTVMIRKLYQRTVMRLSTPVTKGLEGCRSVLQSVGIGHNLGCKEEPP